MKARPFSPEEFVRLLSLPETDPERMRAESSGMLESWRRMLEEFEAPPAGMASSGERASADAALERHLAAVLAGSPRGDALRAARGATGPRFWSRLAGSLSAPVARAATAAAVIVIAAGGAWWAGTRHAPRAVRGAGGVSAIVVGARTVPGGALELSWSPVAGADGYRLRFFGPTLEEIARLDRVPGRMLRLRRDSMPTGLRPGTEVMLEVSALRGGDVIAVSGSRAVRLP